MYTQNTMTYNKRNKYIDVKNIKIYINKNSKK